MKRKTPWGKILKGTVKSFSDDNVFKMSASLSYYTIFSMGPLLIIVISLVGIFYGQSAAEGEVYDQLRSLVGAQAAEQIQQIIQNLRDQDQNWLRSEERRVGKECRSRGTSEHKQKKESGEADRRR